MISSRPLIGQPPLIRLLDRIPGPYLCTKLLDPTHGAFKTVVLDRTRGPAHGTLKTRTCISCLVPNLHISSVASTSFIYFFGPFVHGFQMIFQIMDLLLELFINIFLYFNMLSIIFLGNQFYIIFKILNCFKA